MHRDPYIPTARKTGRPGVCAADLDPAYRALLVCIAIRMRRNLTDRGGTLTNPGSTGKGSRRFGTELEAIRGRRK